VVVKRNVVRPTRGDNIKTEFIKTDCKKYEVADMVPLPQYTVNPRYNGPGYNGQNLAVYDCEFLEMLRH
jgi:hypothetical protein